MTSIPSQLPTIARHVAEQLDRLARNAEAEAERSTDPAEVRFFRRGAHAYRKALYYHLTGIVPVAVERGGYLVPSATRGGVIHRVTAAGCSCEAGSKNIVCWHQCLIVGIEAGLEAAGAEDDGGALAGRATDSTDSEEDADEMDVGTETGGGARSAHPAAAGDLGARLAEARRAVAELWS